jgi:hypothetical protein
VFVQRQVGHRYQSTTAIYSNSWELHQMGEKLQVAMSERYSSGLSMVPGMAA